MRHSRLLIICISLAVEPNRIGFRAPFPGEFFGNSTSPASCNGGTVRYCDDINSNPLTDGDYGDTLDRVYSSKFIAWSESSQFHLIARDNVYFRSIKTVNLFFYHNQMLEIGLPSINVSFSTSSTDEGIIREYTIIGNQDLASGDSKVRNVTLVLTENIVADASHFHITFSLMNGPQLFALSEVELCSNTGIVVFCKIYSNPVLNLLILTR